MASARHNVKWVKIQIKYFGSYRVKPSYIIKKKLLCGFAFKDLWYINSKVLHWTLQTLGYHVLKRPTVHQEWEIWDMTAQEDGRYISLINQSIIGGVRL